MDEHVKHRADLQAPQRHAEMSPMFAFVYESEPLIYDHFMDEESTNLA